MKEQKNHIQMKMNKNRIPLAAAVFFLLLGLGSCEKDFLETSPSHSISDADVFRTTEGAQTVLNGIYFHLRRLGGGGTTGMGDRGLVSLMIDNDAAAGQEKVVWGGWYTFAYQLWGLQRGDIDANFRRWTFLYRIVNNANLIITNIEAASGPQSEKDMILGQALSLRALAYFYLIRYYQHTYIIAQEMPGVPIYRQPATADVLGNPRGTVQEVYDFILEDLTTAVPLLEHYNRGTRKSAIDQSVARGLLAEVYLTMNKWEEAAQTASLARQGYPIMDATLYAEGFNDLGNPEWMWARPTTADDNMSDYGPFSFWANRTREGFSFECFFLNDVFVSHFEEDDIRYADGMIQPEWSGSGLYISFKFRDKPDLTGDIVLMRAANMLLIEAEALARQGRDGEAREVLWGLQDMRNASRTTSSGQDLIDSILLERRKELYGEGHAWFDMLRNQQPMYREGVHKDNMTPVEGLEIWPARSWRFIFQIPFSEIRANESLVDGFWPAGDQNPLTDEVYVP